LADIFLTTSQVRLQGSAANLSQIYLMLSKPCVVTFYVDPKSNMASDWKTHFRLLFKNGCMDLLQSWHKCPLWGSRESVLLFTM